jgi:DNA topoisomerase-1
MANTKKKKTKSKTSSGGRHLVIVESPAKAKTIGKFLGKDYRIKASMGHVRDLSGKGRGKGAMGIDIENDYQPHYAPIKGREKTLKDLQAEVEKADDIYLAPDPDREGEAIAWHLAEALHLPREKTHRITFNAITKSEVTSALANSRSIDMDLVNAQQARRVLDRLVGFTLSPLLWKKVTKGLSAGRVQSVAVRLVVEREKAIQAFVPEEYWRIFATLSAEGAKARKDRFQATLVEWRGRKLWLGEKSKKKGGKDADAVAEPPKDRDKLGTEAEAKEVLAALESAPYRIRDVVEKETSSRPAPPFITSTMQQAASTALRFNTDRTMRVAQQLYEGVEIDGTPTGLITYMRTDAVRVAPEAISEARDHIGQHYDPAYLPEKPNFYSSKKGAQEAHEAIRPTSVALTPDRIAPFLSAEQLKLYDLVWRRFVASQMTPARYHNTTLVIEAGEGVFEAKGRRVVFDGHTILGAGASKKKKKTDEDEDDASPAEDQELPHLQTGDALDCHALDSEQKFTQPPPRYSEASLVRALEQRGIGRPSTYAPIVKTVQERGYVRQEKRRFHATELGIAVTELLERGFPDIMDYNFTAGMEEDLDRIEEGEVDWVGMVDGFYRPFQKKVDQAQEDLEPLKGKPAPNGETCPLCEAEMVVRYSRNGAFLSCSRYPECEGSRPLDTEPAEDEDGEAVPCPECSAPMLKKRSRFGEFLSCSMYPECKGNLPLDRSGNVLQPPKVEATCNKCGKPMEAKRGRRGFFAGCTGYPECKNTKPLDKDGGIIELPEVTGTCEKCGSPMQVKSSRRGPFLACTGYPKCRNAKPLPPNPETGAHIDFSAMTEEEIAAYEKEARKGSRKKASSTQNT